MNQIALTLRRYFHEQRLSDEFSEHTYHKSFDKNQGSNELACLILFYDSFQTKYNLSTRQEKDKKHRQSETIEIVVKK